MTYRLLVQDDFISGSVRMALERQTSVDGDEVAKLGKIEWGRRDRFGAMQEDNVLSLPDREADNLLAAFAEVAWERGWRPEGFQPADTTAQAKHLADMRAMAFASLKIRAPE